MSNGIDKNAMCIKSPDSITVIEDELVQAFIWQQQKELEELRRASDNTAQLREALQDSLEVARALVKWDFRNRREHFKALAKAAAEKIETALAGKI